MDKKETAANLLAQGITPVQVAKTIGVDDSMISQWQAEDNFREMISSKMAGLTQSAIEFDDMLDESELTALENIKARLRTANLQQSLGAFKILNAATRKKAQQNLTPGLNQGAPIVNIVLPTVMMPQFTRNAQSEIVEVEGQSMISASPKQLQELVQQKLGRVIPMHQNTEAKAQRANQILDSVIAPQKRRQPVRVLSGVSVEDL